MNNLKDIENTFITLQQKLYDEYMIANTYYNMAKLISNLALKDTALFNLSPNSYNILHRSLTFSSVIVLDKFFQKSNRVYSLYTFFKFLKANLYLFSWDSISNRIVYTPNDEQLKKSNYKPILIEDINNSISELEEISDILGNVKILRDKFYAHNDKNVIEKPSKKEVKLYYDDIEKILNKIYEILLKYSLAFNESGLVKLPMHWDDINNTFKVLRDFRK